MHRLLLPVALLATAGVANAAESTPPTSALTAPTSAPTTPASSLPVAKKESPSAAPKSERPLPRVKLAVDVPVTAVAGAGWLGLYLAHPALARTSCPCTPEQVPGFERFAVRLDWAPGETLANVAAGITLAAPLVLLAFVADDVPTYFHDVLLVAESVVVAGLLTQIVKTAVSRPYPYMFGPAPFPEQNDAGVNYAAFWSGHTAAPMAAAVTFAYLVHRRRPHTPWRWVAWFVGPALALAAGTLEMTDGNHFPTDIAAGAAVGAAVGLLNPWLHELGRRSPR